MIRWLVLLFIIVCVTTSHAGKLDLIDQHPTRFKTPDDVLVYYFPIVQYVRVVKFKDYAIRADLKSVKVVKLGRIPGRNGRMRFLVKAESNGAQSGMYFESQIGYSNRIHLDRTVWFLPTNCAFGFKPIDRTDPFERGNKLLFTVALPVI